MTSDLKLAPEASHVPFVGSLSSDLRTAVMRLRRRLVNERHPDNELSLGSMGVLGGLYRRGALTVGELAAQERVQPPTMTRLINALAESGYVTREQHESDGRQVNVRITDLGRISVLADVERRDQWLSQRLSELTDAERAVLTKAAPILERLASA